MFIRVDLAEPGCPCLNSPKTVKQLTVVWNAIPVLERGEGAAGHKGSWDLDRHSLRELKADMNS